MSFEIQRHPKKGEVEVEEAESEEKAFEEAVKALNELIFGDTGNDIHQIELKAGNMESLLREFLEELKMLQDTEDLQIGKPKSISIEKDHEELEQKLIAEIYMDKRTGRKYWPVKEIDGGSLEFDYVREEGWRTGFKVLFDTKDRGTPQTDSEF